MLLEGGTEDDEAADVQRHGDIACPAHVRSADRGSREDGSRKAVPKTALSNEDTVVTPDRDVHYPVVEVPAEDLANEDSDLEKDVRELSDTWRWN